MTNSLYRSALPQLAGTPLLTDGGLETTLIFHDGIDLPHFAAFDLLRTNEGRATLKAYYCRYAEMASAHGHGFVLESPTWRASKDWGDRMGYSEHALAAINNDAIDLMSEVRAAFEKSGQPFVISGNIGPRGDGYVASALMTVKEAENYHATQIAIFAKSAADLVSAVTINYVEEAIGIVRAAVAAGIPVAISFTTETDGKLPTGQPLGDAIKQVDAETGNAPAFYMINCAHPDHFRSAVANGEDWVNRIYGLRANASRMSHAELDNAEELDDGNPAELGAQYNELMSLLPNLTVLGGCCGTDHRHIEAISHACYHKHAA